MERLHLHQITTPERTQYYPATVIKIGGASQSESGIQDIAHLAKLGRLPVIIHGGGPQIDAELKKRDIVPQKHNGVRVTDAETLSVVNEVLTKINKDIVQQLQASDINAKGYTFDSGLLTATISDPQLGFVGGVPTVDINTLLEDIAQGIVPVIAPLAVNANGGGILNVNGDIVAGAVAAALKSNLLLVTDVPGVLDQTKSLISELNIDTYLDMRKDNQVTTGMIPKMDAAFIAKAAGGNVSICGSDQITTAVLGEPIATKIVENIFERTSTREHSTKKRGDIFVGSAVTSDIDPYHLIHISYELEERLEKLKEQMVPVKAEELLLKMTEQKAVLSLGEHGELLGCAFLSQSLDDPSMMEVTTWHNVQNDNYEKSGLILMLNAAQLAMTFPEIKKVITKVKATNKRAQEVLGELGAPYTKTEVSERSGNIVFVYNLTEVGRDPYETAD